jgi:hypothetical protein
VSELNCRVDVALSDGRHMGEAYITVRAGTWGGVLWVNRDNPLLHDLRNMRITCLDTDIGLINMVGHHPRSEDTRDVAFDVQGTGAPKGSLAKMIEAHWGQ